MIPLTGNVRTGSDQQPKIATAIKSLLSCTAVTPLHHSSMNVNLAVRSFVALIYIYMSSHSCNNRTHAPTTKTPPQATATTVRTYLLRSGGGSGVANKTKRDQH
jgi:hypothetical protein